jgi:hypothetical protein
MRRRQIRVVCQSPPIPSIRDTSGVGHAFETRDFVGGVCCRAVLIFECGNSVARRVFGGRRLELKSQKTTFGARVADGAYSTMCQRLEASNNPNLMLLNYDLRLGVRNLLVIPKQFFVKDVNLLPRPRAGQAGPAATLCLR